MWECGWWWWWSGWSQRCEPRQLTLHISSCGRSVEIRIIHIQTVSSTVRSDEYVIVGVARKLVLRIELEVQNPMTTAGKAYITNSTWNTLSVCESWHPNDIGSRSKPGLPDFCLSGQKTADPFLAGTYQPLCYHCVNRLHGFKTELNGWLVELNDGLIGWLIEWVIEQLIGWLIDWVAAQPNCLPQRSELQGPLRIHTNV